MFVQTQQMPDGHWPVILDGPRPPLCANDGLAQTVLSMRALQLYAPQVTTASTSLVVQSWYEKQDLHNTIVLLSWLIDRKSTRLNSSHVRISYAVFCLKKKNIDHQRSHLKRRLY